MEIHFLRNATLILRSGDLQILVDPMLGNPGTLPPYAFFRHKPRRNPTVPLPPSAHDALHLVTMGLITHCRFGHFDHLDRAGWSFLKSSQIPVYAPQHDQNYLRRRGIQVIPLEAGDSMVLGPGRIKAIPTRHGYGWLGQIMGPGLGYLIDLPGEPSLYLSGDTVLTADVLRVLEESKPDICIIPAGGASLDIGRPILMPLPEVVQFTRLAAGPVIATHMEALNHCPTSREQLRRALVNESLAKQVYIPADGEVLKFTSRPSGSIPA